MPTSLLDHAPAIIRMAGMAAPRRMLDIGPGFGKFAQLAFEYLPKPLTIDAVEMEPSYVTPRLEMLYDSVICADVLDLPDEFFASYELTLMIDVIEHMEKQAALDLLARIPGRVIVCTPVEFFQNPPTFPSEVHRSHWTIKDFGNRVEIDHSQFAGILVLLLPLHLLP